MRLTSNHRPPLLGCRGVPGADGQHAGVGDRSVQAAKFGDAVVDGGGQRRSVADVDDTW